MPQKGRYYRVEGVPSGLRPSYPLNEVRSGTVVKCLEGAPKGSLDVIDVKLQNGEIRNVYSFQLEKVVKLPKKKRRN